MSEQTLMLIEATGIQEYIFGTNQLAQNIGASELVTQATVDWVVECLNELKINGHNVTRNSVTNEFELSDRSISEPDMHAEIVYMGGGNAMLLFSEDTHAEQFARCLTRYALTKAPGLELVIVRQTFNTDKVVLAQLHQNLRKKLATRKLDRQRTAPLLGLGVTAACVYTGLPAVEEQEEQLISAEVKAKLDATDQGNCRLKHHLPKVEAAGYEFVYNFDDFGEKGESSYLALIHIDGNDMGERIKDIGKHYNTKEENEDYVRALRAFSKSVTDAADRALATTVDMLLDPNNQVKGNDGKDRFGGIVPLRYRNDKKQLPFRPIVFGGDDITFVCEGRLGLTLATKYLDTYSSQTLCVGQEDKPAFARAGVAVVKSHYPFSRAYQLAGDLLNSAKTYILEECTKKGEEGLTAIDWHFAVSGLVLPLKHVRDREYRANDGSPLLMRPVRMTRNGGDWRSWQIFTQIMHEFQDKKKEWAGRRNKIKAFRDSLRAGPDAVEQFLMNYDLELPDIPELPDMKRRGWQGGKCGFYDAIEALDFYVPLKGGLPHE